MIEAERFLQQYEQKEKASRQIPPDPSRPNNPQVIQASGVPAIDSVSSSVLKGWWSLSGRIERRIYILRQIVILAGILLGMIVGSFLLAACSVDQVTSQALGAFTVLLAMPFAIPQHTRRLHDINWSGWWQLLLLIPVLNIAFRLFLCIKPGAHGANKYDQHNSREIYP
jgi:uncharacterized membrane protein YhaH (DUF805 family)